MATFHTTTSEPGVPLSRQLFSVRAAAAYLGVSPSTVRRRIAAGEVGAHRWGRTWILWRDDLDRYWYCTTDMTARLWQVSADLVGMTPATP
jgi:excisionase family DNA binding protein